MTLTVGSLFSGIGGLELGLERAGMRVVWQVESDEYARKVLSKHWPKVRRCEDVRRVHLYDACFCANCLARVDVLCGGFPCQDISNAGQRAGIDGERSGLWAHFARLIRELRPNYVVVENVAALLVRGLGRVLGDLASSGYDAEWDCIPAAAVGAPHRRDRLFVVAYPNGDALRHAQQRPPGRRDDVQDGGGALSRHHGAEEPLAHAACPRLAIFQGREAGRELAGWRASSGGGWWNPEPDVGRVADGVSKRVDRLRCLGNAVVPQVAEFIGRRILAREAA